MDVLKPLKATKLQMLLLYRGIHNLLFYRPKKEISVTVLPELNEIVQHSQKMTDFNEHLVTLFTEGMICRPKLIVELGTRGGESTFVFERVASLCDATLVSVDIEDCLGSCSYSAWNFVKSDDVAFANEFKTWCQKKRIQPEIDLLFIDTSHLYEHTVEEIKAWMPHVAKTGKVIFHDTNLRYFYHRADGRVDIGWNNQRGVIRAIEEYLGCQYDETMSFTDARNGWLVRHWPHCCGLTILDRLPGSKQIKL